MTLATASRHRLFHTPTGWLVILCTAGYILYSLWVLSNRFLSQAEVIVSSLGLIVLDLVFIGFGLYLAFHPKYDTRLRLGWFLLTLGVLCNAIGESLWIYYEITLGAVAFPSIADLFYLLFYPLTLAGLLCFPYGPTTRSERTTLWLDLLIVIITCAMLMWYFILASVSTVIQFDVSGMAALAYPLADLLVLAGVIALILRDVEKINLWTLTFLALAMLSVAIGDVFFAYYEINRIPYSAAYLNVLRLASALFMIIAAYQQVVSGEHVRKSDRLKFDRSRHLLQLALPYLAVGIGFVLLVYAMSTGGTIDLHIRGVLVGMLVLVALVFARQYVVLQENIRLYREMKQMASTDQLTGLYNRHYFNEVFPQLLNRALHNNQPLSVLLIDVNGFKKINDTFGHLRGDFVLKNVAKLLAGQLRSTDLIARFGGDEFVVILPHSERESALRVAERIKANVSTHWVGKALMGVSIGVATMRPEVTPEQMLEEADRDMYRSKGNHHFGPDGSKAIEGEAKAGESPTKSTQPGSSQSSSPGNISGNLPENTQIQNTGKTPS